MTTTSTTTLGDWTVTVTAEQIETTSYSPRPDPDWEAVDANGHTHRYDHGTLPSLRWVETSPVWIDADGDERGPEGYMACTQCGEEVRPGTLPPSPYRTYIAGPVSATATYCGDTFHLTASEYQGLSDLTPRTIETITDYLAAIHEARHP